MTKAQQALLKVLAETRIKNEVIHISVMGGATVMLRNIDVDEESGLLVGENLSTWPDMRLSGDEGAPRPAKTFTCRVEAITGFWA